MEEMLSIVYNAGCKLTDGSRPIRNGDEHHTSKSQSCERVMMTGGHVYFTLVYQFLSL